MFVSNYESTIADLLTGQRSDPLCVEMFNLIGSKGPIRAADLCGVLRRDTAPSGVEHRRAIGDAEAKPRPAGRKHRQIASLLDRGSATEQLEMAEEHRAERAEGEILSRHDGCLQRSTCD